MERVKRDFYVDDFITSVPNDGYAQRVIKETIDLMETTGFVVTKFSSNCKEVLDGLDPDCLAPSLKNINLSKDGLPEQKTLGIAWDAERDEIVVRVNRSEQRAYSRLTRRLAISRLNSYCDPLGLWSPFFVALKLCYSRIVEDTTGWDDYVNTELTHEWNLLLDELASLSSLSVPRQYSSLVDGEYELHLFCDASQYALCACVYLRVIQGNLFDSALVVAKCRLFSHSQTNRFSIARKELVALCVGVDMLKQCEQYLTILISKTYMWVDSMTVIKWCQCKQKQLAQFVRNRVDKILRSTNNNQLPDYINTKTNPADIGSRGIRFKQRKEYEMWCVGLSFLRKPEGCWQVLVFFFFF